MTDPKVFVAVQKVWRQASSDYDAVEKTRTLVINSETTAGEIMEWAKDVNALAVGDVVITEQA